jgi:hypothetical protein
MISLVIFSFCVVGLLAVGASMTAGFREQRDAVSAETLVRLPVDYLGDVLRQASPATPGFNITDGESCTTSALTVTDGGTSGSDQLDVIFASGGVTTTTKTAFTSGSNVDVVDPTGLATGDYVVISNMVQGHLFKITVNSNTLTFTNACGVALPSSGYPAGSMIVRAQHATFKIGTASADSSFTGLVMSNGSLTTPSWQPFADNIEDMQVVVGVDQNADGIGTEDASSGNADEWVYNNSGDSSAWPPASPGVIRAVRVTLVAKSPRKDTGGSNPYVRPAVEDRTAGTADQYRRRVLKTTVEFRNVVGVSP